MTLFVFGLMAGLLLGLFMGRFFYYDDRPYSAATPAMLAAQSDGTPDYRAAAAAGYSVRGDDDLELIEGIGPKIHALLRADGIATFADLAAADVPRLQRLLDAAGPRFKLAQPDSWIAQAQLAADDDWAGLRRLQDALVGGVMRDAA